MKLILKLLALPKRLWIFLLLASVMGIISHLSIIMISLIIGHSIISFLTNNTLNFTVICVLVIICAIIRAIVRYIEQALNHYVAFSLLASIRHDVFYKLRNLPLGKLEAQKKAELLSVISNDVELLEVFFAHTITPIIIAIGVSSIVCIYLSYYSITYTIVLIIMFIILGIIIPLIYYYKAKDNGNVNRQLCAKLSQDWYEIVNGFYSFVNFNKPNKLYDIMIKDTDLLADSDRINLHYTNILKSYPAIIISSCFLLFIIIGIINHYPYQSIIMGICVIVSCFGPINSLTMLGSGLTNTLASAKRIVALLAIKDNKKNLLSLDHINSIKVNELNYQYDQKVLYNNLSLHINTPGIWLVTGKNGCGKSTLFKLLLKYYPISNDKLYYNEDDINKLNDYTIHKHVSLLEQETFFFNASVLDNLLMVKPHASIEEINNALKKAHVYDAVYQHQDNINTIINEDNFSSGEKQRLSLARVILYDAHVWFLDEPSANLDSLTTGYIIDTIKQYQNEKMILIATHQNQYHSLSNKEISWTNVEN